MIPAWQNRIDSARAASPDPALTEIARLAGALRRAQGLADDDTVAAVTWRAIAYTFEHLGGMTADERRATLLSSRSLSDAIRTHPKPEIAQHNIDRVTGRVTRFLAHFDEWQTATAISVPRCRINRLH
jgi:hypothetical protein